MVDKDGVQKTIEGVRSCEQKIILCYSFTRYSKLVTEFHSQLDTRNSQLIAITRNPALVTDYGFRKKRGASL